MTVDEDSTVFYCMGNARQELLAQSAQYDLLIHSDCGYVHLVQKASRRVHSHVVHGVFK